MKTFLLIVSGLCMCGSIACFLMYCRFDENKDRIRYTWTAIRVLPRTIMGTLPDFLLVWDTEIKLALMPKGKQLGKDF